MFFVHALSPRLPKPSVPATVFPDMASLTRTPHGRIALACATLMLAPALSGCKLIDQRTFNPNAGKPPQPYIPPPPPPPAPKPAFLRVEEGTPERTYGPVVDRAAKAALARKPNVLFIVQGFAPAQSDPAAQARALTQLTQSDIAPIAARISAAGAQPVQIEIHAQTDPSITRAYVRVDVR